MAKIIIAGDAMVIESAYTLEELKTLEKYRPKALSLLDSDGKTEIFKVGTTQGGGSINTYGASFGSHSRNDVKKAVITMEIPYGIDDAVGYAEESIGVSIVHLNAVEGQFADALLEVEVEKATVRSNITVM